MIPYNTKLWTIPPREMNCRWLGDRVPEIDIERVRVNIRQGIDDVSWGPNHVFQFPRTGGPGRRWQSVAKHIGPDRIRLSAEAVAVDPGSRSVRLSSGEVIQYDHLITTMPLDRLVSLSGLNDLAAPAASLQFSRVQVVCIGLPTPIPDNLKDKTWIYCPDPGSMYYRITPFSIFSPSHTPDSGRFCSFMCEVGTPGRASMHPEEEMAQRVLDDLIRSGLLNIPPVKPHVFHLHSDYGYPIPTLDRDTALAALLPRLEQMNIWSRGRFGAWKYEVANMDHSIMQGVEVVNRILLGEPEATLPDPSVVNSGKQ